MLSKNIWLGFKPETRNKLAVIFKIGKSSGVEVAGNIVVCDGHTDRDLEAITVAGLQEYLKSKEKDFYGLLKSLVDKLEAPIEEVIKEPVAILPKEEAEKYAKEYKARKTQKTKKTKKIKK